MIRVADYVINELVDQGIKHIFLITGRGILYLTDAVAKNSEITSVSTYHEQGASYAAMAYSAATDGMAACLVSTGCAATNAVTAALCSYQDNLPVIFISGQNLLQETTRYTQVPIRTYGSQEADIIPVIESVTKYATMIMDPSRIGYEMDRAIYSAQEGRKGPVWIDIPLDIQNARVDENALERFHGPSLLEREHCVSDAVLYVKEKLESSKRPILFVGGGIRSAGAVEELKKLVEQNRIPVVFSTAAADAYGSAHELSIGAVGSLGGSRAGNFSVQNADFVLAIGTKLCSQSVGRADQFAREAKVVVIDIDENEHTKQGVEIDRCFVCDAKLFLTQMLKQTLHLSCKEWTATCLHWKDIFAVRNESFVKDLVKDNKIDLYHFADLLSDALSDEATVITDAGLEELIIPSAIRYRIGQRCLFPAAQGAMGYAIPAIIGAHFAGKKDIVGVVGDGSFMMNMQELLVIGANRIPMKLFVINNNMYAVIRKRQQDLFRTRTIGNDPSDGVAAPNFAKIAESFDISYCRIDSEDELETGIASVLAKQGPCICEVMCVPDQKYLHMSYAMNEKRKIVKKPIEDLSPFLDYCVIREEMLIDPIEE